MDRQGSTAKVLSCYQYQWRIANALLNTAPATVMNLPAPLFRLMDRQLEKKLKITQLVFFLDSYPHKSIMLN